MSCFNCCGEDDMQKTYDNGPFMANNAAGNSAGYRATEAAPKETQAVAIQPIAVPAIQVDELKEITDNFGTKSLIGEGSYGRVYHGVLKNGQAAAIKKLDSSKQPDQEFLAQVSMVSRLKHDNVVELLGYSTDGGLRVLAYEYASNGSLHDILHGRKGVKGAQPGPVLSWLQRVKIAVGAAKGLEYLHEKAQPHIIHRDIKSSNVLLFDDDVAKIADFDLSNQAPDMAARLHSTRVLGTFGYHAPEYAMTGQLSSKSDVYSFGVVLLELLTGRKPVDHTLPRGQQSLVTWKWCRKVHRLPAQQATVKAVAGELNHLDIGGRQQIYAWIGCNSAKFGSLYAAAPTRPNNTVSVTSLLGGSSDKTGYSIAHRIVIRTGLNVTLACNIPKDNPMLEVAAQNKLVEKLITLGYAKPKTLNG